MNTNESTAGEIWSLWDVEGLGTLLLTEDCGNVLVQTVNIELDGATLVAVSRSPSGRRAVIEGEGRHPELFETALANHLEIFEIDRANASRMGFDDLAPVVAAPLRMGARP